VPTNFNCDVAGFELIYLEKRQDPVPSQNNGGRFNDLSRQLVSRAKPGDIYIFDNVRVRCPGWSASRQANSMAFLIR
jgi:hypothetical protein